MYGPANRHHTILLTVTFMEDCKRIHQKHCQIISGSIFLIRSQPSCWHLAVVFKGKHNQTSIHFVTSHLRYLFLKANNLYFLISPPHAQDNANLFMTCLNCAKTVCYAKALELSLQRLVC